MNLHHLKVETLVVAHICSKESRGFESWAGLLFYYSIRAYFDFLPQAAWQSIIFYRKTSSVVPPWGTSSKDALLIGLRREEKSPAPGGIQTHNLKSFALQACALPLCYNHCQKMREVALGCLSLMANPELYMTFKEVSRLSLVTRDKKCQSFSKLMRQ